MASFYLAPSLKTLRNEINTSNPSRDKTSDGWIGDASHKARKSDHNPDYAAGGVVRAIDVDRDGVNPDAIVATLIKDDRVNYVIWNGHIWSRKYNFVRRAYTGPNKHNQHLHVSIRHGKNYEDNTTPWFVTVKNVHQLATEVIAGQWGNGRERMDRLSAAGYSYNAVMAVVRSLIPSTPEPVKTVHQLATEVIAGQWGNGDERRARLESAGFNYTEVQTEINRRLNVSVTPARKTMDQLVDEVFAGKWGNGKERRDRLRAAGYNPEAVQAAVNKR
jgi:hypothetical protein